GENAETIVGTKAVLTAQLSEWLSLHCKPEQISDKQCPPGAPLDGIPGNASVPMMANGNFVGILHFAFENPKRPVTAGQLKALNILAGAAASGLEAASLLGRVRAADKQYHRLTENAADIVCRYEFQPTSRVAYVNRAITQATGYSPAEYYADADLLLRIVHPEDRDLMASVLRGECGNGNTAAIRCVHRDGNIVWIEQRAMHVKDAEGRLI